MTILIVDTVSPQAGLDIIANQTTTVPFRDRKMISAEIIGAYDRALEDADITQDDLVGIIVVNGPGSFTSIRVGVSFANALAYALRIPIVGFSRMDWLKAEYVKVTNGTHAGKKGVMPEKSFVLDAGASGFFVEQPGGTLERYMLEDLLEYKGLTQPVVVHSSDEVTNALAKRFKTDRILELTLITLTESASPELGEKLQAAQDGEVVQAAPAYGSEPHITQKKSERTTK